MGVANLDDAFEPEVERLRVAPLEPVVVFIERRGCDQTGVCTQVERLRKKALDPPEDR